jgi:DNA-binding MarR family transcriptional regulator
MAHKAKDARSLSVHADAPATEIAATLKLDRGLGFLVRLLDTRSNSLYEQLTEQNDTLYQQGPLTLTELAAHIRVDRSTLGEMVSRMVDRSLLNKRSNGSDRRSATVSLAAQGEAVLLRIVAGAARLQVALLAPLPAEDRAHFMKCLRIVAEPPRRSADQSGNRTRP